MRKNVWPCRIYFKLLLILDKIVKIATINEIYLEII